jgi:hypothetical protein
LSLDKPDIKECEAMLRLQQQPEFTVFLTMVAFDMSVMNERLIKADLSQSETDKLIGQLRFGARLTDAIEQSKHTLQQHRQPKT